MVKKYKLPYTNNNAGRHDYYANQIYFDYQINDVILHQSENQKTSLKDLYNSIEFQKFINEYRVKSGNNTALGYDYIKGQLAKVKNSFYEDGFANFEDINNIALNILRKDSKITELLASRFPIILVDECQDLSWVEINILDEFKRRVQFFISLEILTNLYTSLKMPILKQQKFFYLTLISIV